MTYIFKGSPLAAVLKIDNWDKDGGREAREEATKICLWEMMVV